MFNGRRSATGGIAGGIVLIGLALAFAFGGFNLPILFIALAVAALVSSLGAPNSRGTFGGIQGFVWLLALALFFATHNWLWFLLAAASSVIFGSLIRPMMMGDSNNVNLFGRTPQQQPPYYQPSQPPPPPYQPYQQGYQPSQAETYREGEQQYHYPPQYSQPYDPSTQQYEQPQAQYPQQMPPQQ